VEPAHRPCDFTTVISSIGLLVGGIGVMNIRLIPLRGKHARDGGASDRRAGTRGCRLQFLLKPWCSRGGRHSRHPDRRRRSRNGRTLILRFPRRLSYLWVTIGFRYPSAWACSLAIFFFFFFFCLPRKSRCQILTNMIAKVRVRISG